MEYKHRPDNAEELKQWIESAFATAAYPGDRNIASDSEHCDECRETDEFFRGKHWRELVESGQRLQFGWGGLSFLSLAAWRFYMPTYLLVGLGENEYASDASWNALYALSPPKSAELADYFLERASGFSLVQQECIAAYAVAFSEMEPEDEDIETAAIYWMEKVTETRIEQSAV